MAEANLRLKTFLHERMYRHSKVERMTSRAQLVVGDLFAVFYDQPGHLPPEWRLRVEAASARPGPARLIADYIAGMTDRFALNEHRRLFGVHGGS